jgi:5'-deoxynucleotidase YfbR-like HD superfamily hydrolase
MIKNGSIHNGKPKRQCKECGRQFVINPTNKTVILSSMTGGKMDPAFLTKNAITNPMPDKWNKDSKYDKKQIIDMLLIHDLSEAITGDIIGKKETDRKNEEEIYKEIELLDTYDGFAKLNYIAKLWGDFEREENLNSKIAKEIDKLDNLIQLWIYAADFNKIPHDFTEWHEGIQRSISTEIGVEIRNRLLKFYEKFYKSKIENLLKKYGFS